MAGGSAVLEDDGLLSRLDRSLLVVERTFAWIMKCRRLVRDYEPITRVAEAVITVAAIATLVRRR